MQLTYHLAESETDRRLHPQGYYWDAVTDDGGIDASGNDPLSAAVALAEQLERELSRAKPEQP